MLKREVINRINRRLDELYWRHLSLHADEAVGYYESGVGYHKREDLEEGHNRSRRLWQQRQGHGGV